MSVASGGCCVVASGGCCVGDSLSVLVSLEESLVSVVPSPVGGRECSSSGSVPVTEGVGAAGAGCGGSGGSVRCRRTGRSGTESSGSGGG